LTASCPFVDKEIVEERMKMANKFFMLRIFW